MNAASRLAFLNRFILLRNSTVCDILSPHADLHLLHDLGTLRGYLVLRYLCVIVGNWK
jgi:hypothetical protein